MRKHVVSGLAIVAMCLPAMAGKASDSIAAVENGLLPAVVLDGRTDRWSLASRMAHWNVPAVSIAVIDEGRVAWARAYGVANAASREPVTPHTRFQAASISKPVAAAAAMALVVDGVLDLDGDVEALLGGARLPRTPEAGDAPITLRQLLSHTAGTSVHGFPGYARDAALPTLRQVVDGAAPANTAAVRVEGPPGHAWRYSGGGYQLVQWLVEAASGQPFADVVQARVLAPAGMDASSYDVPDEDIAAGHDRNGRPLPGGWHVYPEHAAAGLWTTPTDLARFAIALTAAYRGQAGTLLPDASVRTMLTPVRNGYGLGPGVAGERERLVMSHGGSNEGYRAMWVMHPVTGDGVVVMTNGDAGDRLAMEVVRSVSAAFDWPDYKPRRVSSHALMAQQLAAREGTWSTIYDGGRVEFVARRDGTGLAISTARGRFVFVPISPTGMVSLESGAEVVFEEDASGVVLKAFGMTLKKEHPVP